VKKILLVEDDPVARQILATLLRPHYQLIMSGDAMAAFTDARKQQPDLVILDLGLPAGGGFAVLQRLKSIPALAMVPVIVISGLDREQNEQKALDAGADVYLSKPVRNEDVLAAIRHHLGEV